MSEAGRVTRGDVAALTNEVLAECFRGADSWASDVIQTGADQLGWMLAVLRSGVGVDNFVLVGGFAQALGPRYCAAVARAMEQSSWSLRPDRPVSIEPGELGDEAGLLGAGRYGSTALGPTAPTRAPARRVRAEAQVPAGRQAVRSGQEAE
jgi:glucokinase